MACGDPYITVTTSSCNTATGTSYTYGYRYDQYQYNYVYPYPYYTAIPPVEEKKEPEVDVCHLCKAKLIERHLYEWFVPAKKKSQDDEWKERIIKTYECGTEVTEGDLRDDDVRVKLGKGCVKLSDG